MNKITMDQIRKAWDNAVNAFCKYDYKTRPAEMEEFFMTELNKLNHDICDIVTHMYCEYEELYKQNKLIGSDMEMSNAIIRELNNTKESMGNAIEDLESSLVTARYFIFLGSMFAFLLGLACLFLVV